MELWKDITEHPISQMKICIFFFFPFKSKINQFVLDFVTDLRLEDTVNLKLERKPRERNTNVELLGYSMVDAGNDLGPGTQYGKK